MNILLICTGNTCRSAMAEGILKDLVNAYALDDCYVASAGIMTADGLPASHNAICAAAEYGSDISLHYSRQLRSADIDSADLILCMTNAHKEAVIELAPSAADRVYTLAEYVGEPDIEITDPFGGDFEKYAECIAVINDLLEKLVDILREADNDAQN